MITQIRFPAKWAIGPDDWESGNTVFQLGPGPCGKTVERLECDFHSYGVEIVQHCTCNERKVFVYPWQSIMGRVVVTQGERETYPGAPRDYDSHPAEK